MHRRSIALALLLLPAGPAFGPEAGNAQIAELTPVTDETLAEPDPADWLSWRRTLDGWGYSPLDQIDVSNAGDLRLAWSWGLEPGVSQTTPLVHDGVMYVANPGSVVHALDAATGDLLWEYRRPMDDARRPIRQMRSLAVYRDLLILNTDDAHVVGLDARTGEVRWDTPTAPEGTFRRFTSGSIVADGVIVAGMTGCAGTDEDTCYIVGLDGVTGELLWRTSTIARPGEPGGDTWGGVSVDARAGGDAWIPGSYDPAAGLVFWGTSQAKPWARAARGTEGGSELYTNSTLALDPATGAIEWYFQHIPSDSHDMDETFERILVDYDGRRSVFTMGKLGILWELDLETGAFVSAADLGYQTIVNVDGETGELTYRPGMLQRLGEVISFCPSTGGFKSLRAMAYHPGLEAFYVPLNLNCENGAFLADGTVVERSYYFHPLAPDQMGEFAALDLRTGRARWSERRRAPYNTSALATGGGLVFVGAWDRYVFAYDAESGEELWRSRLPTMANGTPVTYAVDGRQYVAFVAGPSIGASSWATSIPPELIPEIQNPGGGSGVFVFGVR